MSKNDVNLSLQIDTCDLKLNGGKVGKTFLLHVFQFIACMKII